MTGNSRGKKNVKDRRWLGRLGKYSKYITVCYTSRELGGGGRLLEPSSTPECKDSKRLRIFH